MRVVTFASFSFLFSILQKDKWNRIVDLGKQSAFRSKYCKHAHTLQTLHLTLVWVIRRKLASIVIFREEEIGMAIGILGIRENKCFGLKRQRGVMYGI